MHVDDEEWKSRLIQTVAQQVRRRRQELGLSVQKLADICSEEYGLPIGRSVLANFEGGRRPALSVVELLVLARILAIPPAVLLFPIGREAELEVLPGVRTDPWTALKWFNGESDRLPSDVEFTQDNAAVRLHREHERLVEDLFAIRREIDMIASTRGREDLRQFRGESDPDAIDDRLLELKAQRLRETATSISAVRSEMRRHGMTPPQMGAEAAYVEPESVHGQPHDTTWGKQQ